MDVILKNNANLPLPGNRIKFFQVDAIETDRPFLGIVEPTEQLDQCRLAGTVLTNQRNHFTRPQLEINFVQSLP